MTTNEFLNTVNEYIATHQEELEKALIEKYEAKCSQCARQDRCRKTRYEQHECWVGVWGNFKSI